MSRDWKEVIELIMQISGCGGVGEGVRRRFQMGNGDSLRGYLGGWWLCSCIEIITCETSGDGIREINQVSPQVLWGIIPHTGRKKRAATRGAIWWDFNETTQSTGSRTVYGGQKRTQMGRLRGY